MARTIRSALLVALAAAVLAPAAQAAYIPNDPGRGGGWAAVQWNFAGPWGVNAPGAWGNLIDAGRPGGKGVVVAVLDTGVAYRDSTRRKRSPDLYAGQFVRGHDFVDHDTHPLDDFGHGTHVASTIAERTNNARGLTGLAYGVKIMPVRVLDSVGEGDVRVIARGIRYAARHHAQVINLSLQFDVSVRADEIRPVLKAMAYAHRKGSLVVGAAGNEGEPRLAYPARDPLVLSVGATTERGCLSDFSNTGANLDLVAPGGGPDADVGDPNCRPDGPDGRNIAQITLTGRKLRRFGISRDYAGTSMAAPHVSAAAALVIASGVLGAKPSPDRVAQRLMQTARDLGQPGHDPLYGWGLIDAAAATNPAIPPL